MPTSRRLLIAQVLERELARHPRLGPDMLDAGEIEALAGVIEDALTRGTADLEPDEGRRPEELTASNDG